METVYTVRTGACSTVTLNQCFLPFLSFSSSCQAVLTETWQLVVYGCD